MCHAGTALNRKWPYSSTGTGSQCDFQTMELKFGSSGVHKTQERHSENKSLTQAGGGGALILPLPSPHPEAFSKPQTEPYCPSQAKFNF